MDDVAALVQEAIAGSPEPLMARFRGMAFRTALEWLADPFAAEDVVQEAFVEALSTLARLREPASFAAWLRAIVRKHADRTTRRPHPFGPSDVAATDTADIVEGRWRDDVVRTALGDLSEIDRTVLTLHYLHDRSYGETAALLGVPVSTVRKRLHDARRRLRPGVASRLREEHPMIGRHIYPDGTPRDGGEPVVIPEPAATSRRPGVGPLWTGIKVIDVAAPLVRGGTFELRGPAGTGQAVNVSEIVTLQARMRDAVAVTAEIAGKIYGGANAYAPFTRGKAADHTLAIAGADATTQDVAMRAAEALCAHGRDVLMIIDRELVDATTLDFAGMRDGGAVTVGVFAAQRPEDPEHDPLPVDTSLVFSRRLLSYGIYPCIDPVASSSKLLRGGGVSKRHAEAAAQLKSLVATGTRLESFMSQPYVVAEQFTQLAGEQVAVDEALSDVERIAAGEADALTTEALLFSGTLDHALQRAL